MMPNNKQVERQGGVGAPMVHHYPEVRGGVCEACGTLDSNVDSKDQYKMCPHYRGMQLRCSYCPDSKNPDDVIYKSVLKITDSPFNPGQLVICCDNFDCTRRHLERFKVSM